MRALITIMMTGAMVVGCKLGKEATKAKDPYQGPRIKVELYIATGNPRPNTVKMPLPKDEQQILYMDPKPFVDDTMVQEAWAAQDEFGRHHVKIQFNSSGSKAMKTATQENISQFVAIFIDGKLVSVPIIQSMVSESCRITGKFTKAEAERIAAGLNAGK